MLVRVNRRTPFSMSRERRLQRPADFTGERIEDFRGVFGRHGLPGLLLAILLLLYPGMSTSLAAVTAPAAATPGVYLGITAALFIALNLYAWRANRAWGPAQLGWVVYLGLLSLWEEWVFRSALPTVLMQAGLLPLGAVVLSNLLFGAAHYFTLRWKWQWCLGAFLGGLALSRQMELHDNLLWITGLHWVATFINTPKPPGGSNTTTVRP